MKIASEAKNNETEAVSGKSQKHGFSGFFIFREAQALANKALAEYAFMIHEFIT